jgi:hypothetical protein
VESTADMIRLSGRMCSTQSAEHQQARWGRVRAVSAKDAAAQCTARRIDGADLGVPTISASGTAVVCMNRVYGKCMSQQGGFPGCRFLTRYILGGDEATNTKRCVIRQPQMQQLSGFKQWF